MQQKKKKNYTKNKRAFDSVLHYYRNLSGIGSLSCRPFREAKVAKNPAKPTPLDFKADVDLCISKIVPKKDMVKFMKAYIFLEGPTEIDQEKWADKTLGAVRHSYEQRLGGLFIHKDIFPVQARGYFYAVRKVSCDHKEAQL